MGHRTRLKLTGIQVLVAAPQQVGELLAAFALAVAPGRVEAQLLHQHQRLLTQVFIPVPRHPPIRMALRTSSLSQWRPRRPRLSDGDRPPHAGGSALVRKGIGPEQRRCWRLGSRGPGSHVRANNTPGAPESPCRKWERKWEEVSEASGGQRGVQITLWQRGHLRH